MKYSKEEMDKWLREKYNVTLQQLIDDEVDIKTVMNIAWDEVKECDNGNDKSMPYYILNYRSRFVKPE